MRYTVTIPRHLEYEIADENMQPLGMMSINTWWPMKARITTTPGDVYEIKPFGFWQTSREIVRNGISYARLIAKWGRGFELVFESGPTIYIRKKSFWRSGDMIVVTADEAIIGHINSWLKFTSLNYQYEIELQTPVHDRELNKVLPFILLYCVRQIRQRQAAAG